MHTQIEQPAISDDPLYRLIHEKKITEFNEQRADDCDFSGLDFRGVDLRGINAQNIDFSNCYFHGSDLRGLDLFTCAMEGSSIYRAHIAGTYFPAQINASEIRLSLKEGTRMRYQ
ncbi:MAG: pentapeptide repeat-containing protein [Rhodothermales bacterium]